MLNEALKDLNFNRKLTYINKTKKVIKIFNLICRLFWNRLKTNIESPRSRSSCLINEKADWLNIYKAIKSCCTRPQFEQKSFLLPQLFMGKTDVENWARVEFNLFAFLPLRWGIKNNFVFFQMKTRWWYALMFCSLLKDSLYRGHVPRRALCEAIPGGRRAC